MSAKHWTERFRQNRIYILQGGFFMLTPENKEIMEVLLSNRYFLYSLMHKVFGRDPDTEMLEILTSDAACEAFGLLSEEEGDIMERCTRFLKNLREEYVTEGFIDKLKTEYTKLFVGPFKLVAPPWESVYRSKEGLLFQESTLAVREFYKKFNMLPEGYPRVADDSLALELDFLAKLSGRTLTALQEDKLDWVKYYLNGQNVFLKNHPLVWVPKFLEKMAQAPSDYLYPQMSLVVDDFLKKDQKVVEEILQMIEE